MTATIAGLAAVALAAVGITNRHNRQRTTVHVSAHDMAAVVFIVIVAVVLLVLPAQAQCDAECGNVPEPPVAAMQSDTLYMPAVSWHFPSWFTDDELTQAMVRDGYDPDVASMHTVCTLDASATPPHDVRYSSCEQYYVDGVPTEGTGHFIWWLRMGNGVVTGVEVGGTMVQASGTDAPCYVEDDGEVTCG